MLRVKKILIKNFKSIKEEIEFDIDNWNMLLGQNESGKSNVINGIINIWNYINSNKNNNNFYYENANFFLRNVNDNPITLKIFFLSDENEIQNIEKNVINLITEKLNLTNESKNKILNLFFLDQNLYIDFSISNDNKPSINSNLIKINDDKIINIIINEIKEKINIQDLDFDLYEKFKNLKFDIKKSRYIKLLNYKEANKWLIIDNNFDIKNYIQYETDLSIQLHVNNWEYLRFFDDLNITNFLTEDLKKKFINNFFNSKIESLKEYFEYVVTIEKEKIFNILQIKNNKYDNTSIKQKIKEYIQNLFRDINIIKKILNFDCILWEYSNEIWLNKSYELKKYKSIENIQFIPLKNILNILFVQNKIENYIEWKNSLKRANEKKRYSIQISNIIEDLLKNQWYLFEEQNYKIEVEINDDLMMKIQICQYDEVTKDYLVNYFSQRSEGFKRFASFILFLNRDTTYKNKLILIDEIENHLHLDAFINLLKYINKLSSKKDFNYSFIISTLSPFINNKEFVNVNYFLVSKNGNYSTKIEKKHFNSYLDYADIIGFNIIDYLIKPDFFFLVEGDSDLIFWDNFLHDKMKTQNYLIWQCKGASSILKDFEHFKKRIKLAGLELKNVHAIFDYDNEGKEHYINMKDKYGEIKVHYINEFIKNDVVYEDFVLEDIYNRNLIVKFLEKMKYQMSEDDNDFLSNCKSIKNYKIYNFIKQKKGFIEFMKNEISEDKFNISKKKIKNKLFYHS